MSPSFSFSIFSSLFLPQILHQSPAFGHIPLHEMKTGRAHDVSEWLNNQIPNDISNDQLKAKFENMKNMIEKLKEMQGSGNGDLNTETPQESISPKEILQQIFGHELPEQDTPHEEEEVTHPSLGQDSSITEAPHQVTEAPTGTTVTQTRRLRVKIMMHNVNDTGDSETTQESPEGSNENGNSDLHNLWRQTVPILVRNNQASVHPHVGLDDLSTILPGILDVLRKLHQVHRPGHFSMVMLNPHSVQADKDIVRKTRIIGLLRHILINNNRFPFHDEDMEPQASPWSDEDEGEFDRAPAEEDQDDEEQDAPWGERERHVISHVLANVHHFHGPQHISAVTFNPRHVVEKKHPITLIQIPIRVSAPSVVNIRIKTSPIRSDSEDYSEDQFHEHSTTSEDFPDSQYSQSEDASDRSNSRQRGYFHRSPERNYASENPAVPQNALHHVRVHLIPLSAILNRASPFTQRPSSEESRQFSDRPSQREDNPFSGQRPLNFQTRPMENEETGPMQNGPMVTETQRRRKLTMMYFVLHKKHPEPSSPDHKEASPDNLPMFRNIVTNSEPRDVPTAQTFRPEIRKVPDVKDAHFRGFSSLFDDLPEVPEVTNNHLEQSSEEAEDDHHEPSLIHDHHEPSLMPVPQLPKPSGNLPNSLISPIQPTGASQDFPTPGQSRPVVVRLNPAEEESDFPMEILNLFKNLHLNLLPGKRVIRLARQD